MAKKNGNNRRSSDGIGFGKVMGICCATAIVLSIIIFFVNLVLRWAGVSLSGISAKIMGAMNMIQSVAVAIAVCLGAYLYSRGRKQSVRLLILACIIVYLILAVVWGLYGIL